MSLRAKRINLNKTFLLLVLFCFLSNPAFAAIALVANTCASGPVYGQNLTTSTINTTGATLIVISVSYYAGVNTPTDSNSNTWTALNTYSVAGNVNTVLYYSTNPTTSSSQTFTEPGGTNYPGLCVMAFSGTATSPLDVQNGNTTASGTTLTTGSVTPSTNNEVLITGIGFGAVGTMSINNSFTIPFSNGQINYTSPGYGVAIAYNIQSTATAVNPTWTTTGTSVPMATSIATFEAAPSTAVISNINNITILKGSGTVTFK